MSYRLKKDLRNIIKFYGNPAGVVRVEDLFRASQAGRPAILACHAERQAAAQRSADLNLANVTPDLGPAALVGESDESIRMRSGAGLVLRTPAGALSLNNLKESTR